MIRTLPKILLISLFFITPVYADSVSTQILNSLKLWQPKSVNHKQGIVEIISKERRVTETIYQAMIGGICTGIIKKPKGLKGVSEIQILNRFGKQGYIFEGGQSECREYNKMPAKQTKIYLLGRTHMY